MPLTPGLPRHISHPARSFRGLHGRGGVLRDAPPGAGFHRINVFISLSLSRLDTRRCCEACFSSFGARRSLARPVARPSGPSLSTRVHTKARCPRQRTWRCETSGEAAAAALPFADSFLACAAKRLQQACFSFEGRGRRQHRCRSGNCEAPGGRRHCRRPDARCSVAAAASKVEAAGPSPDKRAARGERNLGLHTAAPGLRSRGRRETVQRLPTAFFTGRSRDASSLSFLSPRAFRLDIQ